MSDDEKKVHDLSIRRREQIQNDPVMQLADRIVKELVSSMDEVDAAGQLVALDLALRATTQALTHSLGEVGSNSIIVEYEHRRCLYSLEWPKHDQSPTVYDGKPKEESADVVPLKRDDDSE